MTGGSQGRSQGILETATSLKERHYRYILKNYSSFVKYALPSPPPPPPPAIFPCYGRHYIGSLLYNRNSKVEGEGSLEVRSLLAGRDLHHPPPSPPPPPPQAPDRPGQYQVRYCPAWLRGMYTGYKHDLSVAMATITVTAPS